MDQYIFVDAHGQYYEPVATSENGVVLIQPCHSKSIERHWLFNLPTVAAIIAVLAVTIAIKFY